MYVRAALTRRNAEREVCVGAGRPVDSGQSEGTHSESWAVSTGLMGLMEVLRSRRRGSVEVEWI